MARTSPVDDSAIDAVRVAHALGSPRYSQVEAQSTFETHVASVPTLEMRTNDRVGDDVGRNDGAADGKALGVDDGAGDGGDAGTEDGLCFVAVQGHPLLG